MAEPTFDQFRDRTDMPVEDVDDLQQRQPGWLQGRVVGVYAEICARLKKRYQAPFAAPIPEVVLGWMTSIVTLSAYKKRGYNPTSAQDQEISKEADRAWAAVKEAADSEEGLYDLPLRQDAPGSSGVSQGGPFGYSEASPYEWTDVQREAVRR